MVYIRYMDKEKYMNEKSYNLPLTVQFSIVNASNKVLSAMEAKCAKGTYGVTKAEALEYARDMQKIIKDLMIQKALLEEMLKDKLAKELGIDRTTV